MHFITDISISLLAITLIIQSIWINRISKRILIIEGMMGDINRTDFRTYLGEKKSG